MKARRNGSHPLPPVLTVSVVVATYRRPERLAACLTALRTQRRSPDEVVVVVHESDEASRRTAAGLSADWPQLRVVTVDTHGSVAAYNRGLAAARGSIVAYVDDDAVPEPDWLERILETFDRDDRIAAVGGRDIVVVDGRVDSIRDGFGAGDGEPAVGRVQWFGRIIANHHVGVGQARDVDVLKGVNMSFRRSAVAELGFDPRLRGHGAQVHSELSICLPLRKQGLRIVYDPAIAVVHYPAPRPAGDDRVVFDREAASAAAHNEALQILDYFGAVRRPLYVAWGFAIGTTEAPGLAVTVRDLLRGRAAAWSRFTASQRGRAAAWRTLRIRRSEVRQPRLRILRVADVPRVETAGMSGYLLSSGAEIERRGHPVTYWFRDSLMPSLESPGLRRLIVPWLIAAKVLWAQRPGQRFDVVEIHEPLAATYALLARLLRPRLPACVVLSFGLTARFWAAECAHLRVYGRKPRARSRILVPLTLLSQARVGLRAADAVLVPSTADREHLVRRVGVPDERVSCAFTGRPEVVRETPFTPHPDVRLLFLGSWIERKGTLELVAAWRRLSRERGHVRLTLAGVGDADAARTAVHGLAHVELIPAVGRDELPSLLAAHDVFVLPSWFEGMPLSMLEAAAGGLACVVSAVCGNLDVFRPPDPQRDGALLVPPNDPDALYRALLTVVDDDRLRSTLGARARERARHFTWRRNAEQTLEAFATAVDRHRGLRS